MIKSIPLTRNRFAVVDAADYEWLSQWTWQYTESGNGYGCGYASHGFQVKINGKSHRRSVRMHRLIMSCPDDMFVDHIDGNTLNNTRENLRICTHLQNHRNKKKTRRYKGRPTISQFKGVNRASKNTWLAKLQKNRERIYLGCYPTEEEAARAYDAAAREHFGEFAKLNFPEKWTAKPGSGEI